MKLRLILPTEKEYEEAKCRFEEIYDVGKASPHFAEMKLLALFISAYKKNFAFPPVDPIEMIKIRMADFGYKPADLAKEQGDKGTTCQVLNDKQPLSLKMIRLFSKKLRIPAGALIREYDLQ